MTLFHSLSEYFHREGFFAGFIHPVLGFDHLLAMLGVGVLSAQIGGLALWTVPSTFVAVMAIGGGLGILGFELPLVELAIAFSVIALGGAIAIKNKLPPYLAKLFVAIFALFHGHAHGVEIPTLVTPVIYTLGFISGTASIHLVGVAIGVVSKRKVKGDLILRFLGIVVAGIGLSLVAMR